MNHETQESKVLRFIKENWVVLMFLVGLVVTWTNFQNAISDTQKRVTELERKVSAIDTDQSKILEQLARIQTDIQWIKTNINK